MATFVKFCAIFAGLVIVLLLLPQPTATQGHQQLPHSPAELGQVSLTVQALRDHHLYPRHHACVGPVQVPLPVQALHHSPVELGQIPLPVQALLGHHLYPRHHPCVGPVQLPLPVQALHHCPVEPCQILLPDQALIGHCPLHPPCVLLGQDLLPVQALHHSLVELVQDQVELCLLFHLYSVLLDLRQDIIMTLVSELTLDTLTSYIHRLLEDQKQKDCAEINLERDLVNSKLARTSEVLAREFNDRIKYLENKVDLFIGVVKNENTTINCKVSDVDLKLETFNTYNEQLMYNLKPGLYDVLSSIQKHDVPLLDQHARGHGHYILPVPTLPHHPFPHLHLDQHPLGHNHPHAPAPVTLHESFHQPQFRADHVHNLLHYPAPTDHVPSTRQDIPQCDGNDTIADITEHEINVLNPTVGSRPLSPPNITSRASEFSLNQHNQVTDIADDATIDNFVVNVSNSDENVCIKCNSGFYKEVARESLCNFNQGFNYTTKNIIINCTDLIKSHDQAGIEYNRILTFSLSVPLGNILGKVTIHLHHTTRRIQIQGGSKMPDGSKSPIWFVENVVLDRFKCLAKRHNYSIQAFNQQAKTAVPLQQNIGSKNLCSGCKNPLKSSAAPFQCNTCSGFFHKRKCFPGHQCLQPQVNPLINVLPGPSSSSLQSSSIPPPCSSPSVPSPTQSSSCPTSIPKPPPTSSLPVLVLPHSVSPPSSSPFQSTTDAPPTNQTLNPDANPFQSRSKPLYQKKSKQTVLNLEPSKVEAEFLKKELNIAKAKTGYKN